MLIGGIQNTLGTWVMRNGGIERAVRQQPSIGATDRRCKGQTGTETFERDARGSSTKSESVYHPSG